MYSNTRIIVMFIWYWIDSFITLLYDEMKVCTLFNNTVFLRIYWTPILKQPLQTQNNFGWYNYYREINTKKWTNQNWSSLETTTKINAYIQGNLSTQMELWIESNILDTCTGWNIFDKFEWDLLLWMKLEKKSENRISESGFHAPFFFEEHW